MRETIYVSILLISKVYYHHKQWLVEYILHYSYDTIVFYTLYEFM